MKTNFTISAFADEIDAAVSEQIRVLNKTGISHVELRGLDGKNVSDLTLAEARAYKKQFDQGGIKVSSIGSPIGKIGIKDDFAPHLAQFKHVLEIATIFETKYIRMFSFFIDQNEDPNQYTAEVVARWQQFLAVAADYPAITLLHENEKEIYGDTPERCVTLLEALHTDKVKFVFDPANFVQCDVEVYPKAYQLMKDNIVYMHIKDAKYSDHSVTPVGLGDGQVEKVLQALVADGFTGFTSLEPHLSEFAGFADLEKEGISIAHKTDKVDGEVLFGVASGALKKIFSKMEQEWK